MKKLLNVLLLGCGCISHAIGGQIVVDDISQLTQPVDEPGTSTILVCVKDENWLCQRKAFDTSIIATHQGTEPFLDRDGVELYSVKSRKLVLKYQQLVELKRVGDLEFPVLSATCVIELIPDLLEDDFRSKSDKCYLWYSDSKAD